MAVFPLLLVWRPTSTVLRAGLAVAVLVVAVQLFADRDVAPVFGHLSPLAGEQHR
jgi:hypothetical protein